MDQFKIITFHIDEVVFEPVEAAQALEKACLRQNRFWRVTGCCHDGEDLLIFPLETVSSETYLPPHYCFSRLPDLTLDAISADLRVRFTHGMSCLGTFRRNDEVWGLFTRL